MQIYVLNELNSDLCCLLILLYLEWLKHFFLHTCSPAINIYRMIWAAALLYVSETFNLTASNSSYNLSHKAVVASFFFNKRNLSLW